ncbi:MAG: hypothetical protein HY835_02230 [Anaerolineae bacterium]|nr:hypothetical protein [Anaerolineae bacterium]
MVGPRMVKAPRRIHPDPRPDLNKFVLDGALLPGFAGFLARTFSLEVIPLYLTALIFRLFLLYSLSLRSAIEKQA